MTLVSKDRSRSARSRSASFPRARADGGHDVVDPADVLDQRRDGGVVGDVDRLRCDRRVVVGGGQCRPVAPSYDDARALGGSEFGDRAGDAAAAADHEDRPFVQGVRHGKAPSRVGLGSDEPLAAVDAERFLGEKVSVRANHRRTFPANPLAGRSDRKHR
jgi:hypothetical protein